MIVQLIIILSCLILCASDSARVREDFLWGVSTAAYQIEGAWNEDGRGPSIWDTFSAIPGKVYHNENGSIADDSYHKVMIDIGLLKAMGLKAYRLSISWTRILPIGYGDVNQKGIDHYHYVIDQLVLGGIEPLVTLYHWDLPQGLEDKYLGWLSGDIRYDFVNFADICFREYGGKVKKWITINEPWTSAVNAYGKTGVFAPGRCSNRTLCTAGNSSTESYIVAHNMLIAHAAAVQHYRQYYQPTQQGIIGITLNHDWAEPLNPDSEDDVAAAQRHCEFSMAWFTDPIHFGRYPQVMVDLAGSRLPSFTAEESALLRGSFDFIGLNHYTSKYYQNVNHTLPGEGGWFDDQHLIETPQRDGKLIGPQAASVWLQVVPWGFYNVIMWLHNRYATALGDGSTGPLIYVTENGVDVPGESEMSIEEALNDTFRINYYSGYLAEMDRAIKDGANIVGYFAWSLMDNFEWADGYSKRFGMHYVDYSKLDRPRYPKASAQWFAQYAAEHKDTYPGRIVSVEDEGGTAAVEKEKPSEKPWTWLDFLNNAIANNAGNLFDL